MKNGGYGSRLMRVEPTYVDALIRLEDRVPHPFWCGPRRDSTGVDEQCDPGTGSEWRVDYYDASRACLGAAAKDVAV